MTASVIPNPLETHGYLLVNKPSGPTSYDIIRWVKRNLKDVKIGHCGTLDPMASGLLILLFGRFTKKQSDIMGRDKVYRFTIRSGIKTDTGDMTGKIIEEKAVPELNESLITQALNSFQGEIEQLPPIYSALKVQGTPMYKLARQGKPVERTPRKIQIKKIEFLRIISVEEFEVRVLCSSGTYVRSLAEDISVKLNTVGTLSALVRESIGPFELKEAIPGEELKTISSQHLFLKLNSFLPKL
ncbi:MAG: tRNA pseudouridine(55) synthase TruB [Elusimicrobiota bacterium]